MNFKHLNMWNDILSTLYPSSETPVVPINPHETTWVTEWDGNDILSTSTLSLWIKPLTHMEQLGWLNGMGVTFFQLQHYFRWLNPLDRWFLFDSQAIGVELVHTLVCGEALQLNNLEPAYILVNHIVLLASLPTGAMSKVAKYFAKLLLGESTDFREEYYLSFYRLLPISNSLTWSLIKLFSKLSERT